jgi:hypothetical protein
MQSCGGWELPMIATLAVLAQGMGEEQNWVKTMGIPRGNNVHGSARLA